MKKIISLILALTMVFALAVTASAVDIEITAPTTDGTYGEDVTYTAYKVFSASVSEDKTKASYTISSSSPFYDVVQDNKTTIFAGSGTSVPGTTDEYYVTVANGYDADDVIEVLSTVTNKGTGKTATYSNGKFIIKNVEEGYYYIESSFGTGIILDTVGKKTITVEPKNELPTIEKSIVKVNNQAITATDSYTAKIGDTVTFELKVTIPATAKVGSTIVLHDYMDSSLDAGNSNPFWGDPTSPFVDNDHSWNGGHDLTHSKMGELTITADMLGTSVVATYTATLNTDAVVGGAGNKNKAWIEYENYTSEEDEVTVYTYGFNLNKTNTAGATITGAEFILSKNSNADVLNDANYGENWILFTNSNNTYTAGAAGGTQAEYVNAATITAGNIQIRGLDKGTYYLHEIKAPDGYNKLAAPIKIEITDDGIKRDDGEASANLTITVVNESGTVLPSTGGMGTTLFYVLGSLMAVTALVVLVTNKRMRT